METDKKIWTFDDLQKLPDDGTRYEIIDGELMVMSSPSLIHQRVLGRLHIALHRQVQETGQGEVFLSPLDVIMSQTRVVEPDLIVVLPDRKEILRHWIEGVPSLVIEIVSPSNPKHDRVTKRRFYARNRVPEYWIVDPDAQTVEVLALIDGGLTYQSHGWYGPGDLLRSSIVEIELAIDELFAP